jgi:hypothetical protein
LPVTVLIAIVAAPSFELPAASVTAEAAFRFGSPNLVQVHHNR